MLHISPKRETLSSLYYREYLSTSRKNGTKGHFNVGFQETGSKIFQGPSTLPLFVEKIKLKFPLGLKLILFSTLPAKTIPDKYFDSRHGDLFFGGTVK